MDEYVVWLQKQFDSNWTPQFCTTCGVVGIKGIQNLCQIIVDGKEVSDSNSMTGDGLRKRVHQPRMYGWMQSVSNGVHQLPDCTNHVFSKGEVIPVNGEYLRY